MSRLILYLARTLEPPAQSSPAEVYGLRDDGAAESATVVGVDEFGITVEVVSNAYGCQTWHIDLPQVK